MNYKIEKIGYVCDEILLPKYKKKECDKKPLEPDHWS